MKDDSGFRTSVGEVNNFFIFLLETEIGRRGSLGLRRRLIGEAS